MVYEWCEMVALMTSDNPKPKLLFKYFVSIAPHIICHAISLYDASNNLSSPLLFVIVMEVITKELWVGLPWELLGDFIFCLNLSFKL